VRCRPVSCRESLKLVAAVSDVVRPSWNDPDNLDPDVDLDLDLDYRTVGVVAAARVFADAADASAVNVETRSLQVGRLCDGFCPSLRGL